MTARASSTGSARLGVARVRSGSSSGFGGTGWSHLISSSIRVVGPRGFVRYGPPVDGPGPGVDGPGPGADPPGRVAGPEPEAGAAAGRSPGPFQEGIGGAGGPSIPCQPAPLRFPPPPPPPVPRTCSPPLLWAATAAQKMPRNAVVRRVVESRWHFIALATCVEGTRLG